MEVQTVDEQGFSFRRALLYTATALGFVALVNVPYFFSPPYAKFLKTVVLVIVVSMMGRMLVSAVLSFKDPDLPPPVPEADLPSVSVVIPAYNEASVLEDTIEVCKDLDYPKEKLEVVLAYEADCTDETGEICERAAAEDSRFVAVERDEPGGGKALAANFAIRHSSNDIIASIDADHEFAPDALKRVARWFHADEDVWCVKGRCFGKNPTDSVFSLHATVERHIEEKADLYARDIANGFTIFGGGQGFFRRRAFEELGYFDTDVLVEDVDMSTRIHLAGKDIKVDPGIITYEEHPATLDSLWNQRKRWARGWLQVSRKYFPKVVRSSNLPLGKRLDGAYTFAFILSLPFLIAGVPFPVYDLVAALTGEITAYEAFVPYSQLIWTLLGFFPPAILGCVFLQDYYDDFDHHLYEYLSAATLGVFLFVQSVFYVIGILDEWVYDEEPVYVTTSRVDDDLDDGARPTDD